MNIPLLADKSGKISRDYGVYIEEEGITFRGLFIIDKKGALRQITINDLPVRNRHSYISSFFVHLNCDQTLSLT